MNLLELDSLLHLLNKYGVTNYKNAGVEIIIPVPSKSFAEKIMTISPEEISAISERASEIEVDNFVSKKKMFEEDEDDILFSHEKF